MHPALRQTAAGLAALTPQSIQTQAAAAAAALCGIPSASMAALAMRNSTAVPTTGQLLTASPYLTAAANPLVRKLLPSAAGSLTQKMYGANGEEILLESTAVVTQSDLNQSERWVLNRHNFFQINLRFFNSFFIFVSKQAEMKVPL
jgi:hypothetical protein